MTARALHLFVVDDIISLIWWITILTAIAVISFFILAIIELFFPLKRKKPWIEVLFFLHFFNLAKTSNVRMNSEFVADLPTNRPWWTSWFSGHAVDMIRCSALPILFHIKGSIFSKAEDYIVLVCESWPSRTIDAAAIVFSAV